ncbi:hypothetical protein CRG98_009826 [Punica granatum]|uniref:Uncharacterized protein n=1 Tax=Punica granatum TaxID=22663 RepID=A0A2I0KN88_PUNGR|nr:hypothetical protein CRG98_009826 [Punica granatum]
MRSRNKWQLQIILIHGKIDHRTHNFKYASWLASTLEGRRRARARAGRAWWRRVPKGWPWRRRTGWWRPRWWRVVEWWRRRPGRGCQRKRVQHIGAYINLGAFYLVGLPLGLMLGFVAQLRAKGFWIGIVSGTAVQSALLALITAFTDWRKQENVM